MMAYSFVSNVKYVLKIIFPLGNANILRIFASHFHGGFAGTVCPYRPVYHKQKRIIMARIKGISPAKMSGSVGDFTYRQTKNGTIVSEKIQKKANPKRTLRQMKRRTVLANLVAIFKAFEGGLSRAFEKMPQGWNEINAFISANSQRARIYLTKNMVMNGASVVDSFQITRGSLRPIEVVATGNAFRTDLSLGSLVISAATTVAEFAKALVMNNAELHYGDQISYFAIRQYMDANGMPRVEVKKHEVTLDPASDEKLWDVVANDGFQTNGGFLGQLSTSTALVGGFVWVLSREVNGSLLVSTQFVHSTNALMVADYSSAEAMEEAILSYGGLTTDVFLQPGSVPGSMPGLGDNEGGNVAPTPSTININVVSANPTMGSVSGSGNYVEGATVTISATANSGYKFTQWQDGNTQNPRQITASESKTYTASFATNSGSGGGMMGD